MEFKLIIKKINNTLSEEEQKIFQKWYDESPKHRIYFSRVQKNYTKNLPFIDTEKAWQELSQKINFKDKKNSYRWKTIAVAAAIIALIIVFPFLSTKERVEEKTIFTENIVDILPGTDKALLTLEDGKQIALEKNKKINLPHRKIKGEQLIYDKELATNQKALKYNYITVPKGGEFHLELSDGTKVWLNSETKFKYPILFAKNQTREVELIYGEAYFEVTPISENERANFKVYTSMQHIDVLGTQFNINAYKEEAIIATTLVKGKVSISDGITEKTLSPNEQSLYNKDTQKMTVVKVDTYNEISWRRGEFSFRNKPLAEITKVLSRWYDIDIIISNDDLKNTKFTGVLSKDQDLKYILETINKTTPINFKITKGKVVLR